MNHHHHHFDSDERNRWLRVATCASTADVLILSDAGMAAAGGMGSYSQAGTDAAMVHGHRQLSSQWSFSRQDLPQISEMGLIPDIGESIVAGGCNSSSDGGGGGGGAQAQSSYLSRNFSVSSWDDTNSIMFSSPSKKPKVDAADDMVTSFSNIDSQVSARP